LEIIDISDPTAPFEVGRLVEERYAYGVHVVGGYAYMVDGRSGGLFIIDISDPTTPTDVGQVSDGGIAKGVMVQGDYAYIADVNDGLEIIDISDPTSPVEVGQIDNGVGAVCVFVSGSYAYVGDGCGWMRIIDISVPSNPVKLAVLIDFDSSVLDIYVSGAYAYVVDYYDGLKIIDISDPAAPTEVKLINNGGDAKEVDMSGSYVYVVGYFGLEIIEPWGQKETISNVIFWSFLGVLILLALVDLRYLFTEMKPHWTESSQKWREAIDPYKAGEKYKAFDFFLGFFMMIGEVVGLFPLFFAYYYGWIPLFGLIIMLIGLGITDFLFVNLILTKGRRYIAIGMLIVAPLFIFGLSVGFLWY